LSAIRDFYAETGTDEIAFGDLSRLQYSATPRIRCLSTVRELFRIQAQLGDIYKKIPADTLCKYAEKNWPGLWIHQVFDLLQHDKKVEVRDSQREMIKNWCLDLTSKVDFRNAITVTNGTTSVEWNAIYIWFFSRKLDFVGDLPESVRLDMLSFDHLTSRDEPAGIAYLEAHLPHEAVKARIFENLKAGIVPSQVFINHLDYCKRYKIQEAIPFAQQVLCDSKLYHGERIHALELIQEMSPDLSKLEEILGDMKDGFIWHVVEILFKAGSKKCREWLQEIMKSDSIEAQEMASCYLIEYGDIDALKWYANRLFEKKDFIEQAREQERNPLASLRDTEGLPTLLDILRFCYSEGWKADTMISRLENVVLTGITAVGTSSDESYLRTCEAVTAFIEKNNDIDDVRFLHAYLERLERQYLTVKSQEPSLAEVIAKLDELGL
jgi:hypothetical protein